MLPAMRMCWFTTADAGTNGISSTGKLATGVKLLTSDDVRLPSLFVSAGCSEFKQDSRAVRARNRSSGSVGVKADEFPRSFRGALTLLCAWD